MGLRETDESLRVKRLWSRTAERVKKAAGKLNGRAERVVHRGASTLSSSCSRGPRPQPRYCTPRGLAGQPLPPAQAPAPFPARQRRRQRPARPASRRWEGAGRPGQTHVSAANPGVEKGERLG